MIWPTRHLSFLSHYLCDVWLVTPAITTGRLYVGRVKVFKGREITHLLQHPCWQRDLRQSQSHKVCLSPDRFIYRDIPGCLADLLAPFRVMVPRCECVDGGSSWRVICVIFTWFTCLYDLHDLRDLHDSWSLFDLHVCGCLLLHVLTKLCVQRYVNIHGLCMLSIQILSNISKHISVSSNRLYQHNITP